MNRFKESYLKSAGANFFATFDDSQEKDSAFINCAITDLYSIKELEQLTLGNKPGKKFQISEENKQLLEELFSLRLSYVAFEEIDTRKKKLSKLIRITIDNTKKQLKLKKL